MSSTFNTTMRLQMDAVEIFSDDSLGDDNTLTHNAFSMAPVTLNASSTPPVTDAAYDDYVLSSGALTINLAAVKHRGTTKDATGLKIVGISIKAPSTNGAVITIAKGASTGHTGLGSAFSIKMDPGDYLEKYLDDNGVTIASGNRTFDLAGTGSSDKLQIGFLFGS